MAQEFASDSSIKNGFFNRFNLSNHRGFFSVIFVSLSLVLLLVTFAAVRQQQTTQTKAATVAECSKYNSYIEPEKACSYESQGACTWDGGKCLPYVNCSKYNNLQNGDALCSKDSYGRCTWDEVKKCIPYTTSPPTCKTKGLCKTQGECCLGYDCTSTTGTLKYCVKRAGTCERYTGQACGSGGKCQTSATCSTLPVDGDCMVDNEPGTYKSGLCPGGTETRCCVPNNKPEPSKTPTKTPSITCNKLLKENTCNANNNCYWRVQKDKCFTKCQKEIDQTQCDVRNDCYWNDKVEKANCKPKCIFRYTQNTCAINKECTWENDLCKNKKVIPVNKGVDLNLKLAFQGIVSKPKTKSKVRVRVKLVDAVNKESARDGSQFTVDDNGIWSGKVSFKNIDINQKYYFLIKGPLHVQKKICQPNAADPSPGYYSCVFGNITLKEGINNFDFSNVKFLVGDIDQNGVVDSLDTTPLRNALLLSNDQRQADATLDNLDLNFDGIVNPQDWGLMLEALKIKYDEK